MGSAVPKQVAWGCLGRVAECEPACEPARTRPPPWGLVLGFGCEVSLRSEVTLVGDRTQADFELLL